MSKKRQSLTLKERCQITLLLSIGVSIRSIAKCLNRAPSVICRELKSNSVNEKYDPEIAYHLSYKRRKDSRRDKFKIQGSLETLILEGLKQQWSPQQIAGRLRNQGVQISHESIYRYVWRDKYSGGALYKHLRHAGKKYNKRAGKTSGRGLIPGRVDIDERPKIVENKERLGDWEADTVIGAAHQGALVTLVDRHSKLVCIKKVPSTTKKAVTRAIVALLKPFKDRVHTITFDNGKEFADHIKIAKALKAQTFFAKPYHSWERGLNEHTNGLIRQYLPKSSNFLKISAKFVQCVQKRLNNRPRHVLSFRTPDEVFFAEGVA